LHVHGAYIDAAVDDAAGYSRIWAEPRSTIVRISEQLAAPPNVQYLQDFNSTLIEDARKSRTTR
jgi:hypothetical protein